MIRQPFHIVYTNHDYTENVDVIASERSAALKLLEWLQTSISPLEGITDVTWQEMQENYNSGNWKGASIFKVEAVDEKTELSSIPHPKFDAKTLSMAELTYPLRGNDPDPVFAILMNKDYVETALIVPDLETATRKLIEIFGIPEKDRTSYEDIEAAFAESYESGAWKGCLVVEIDPVSLEFNILDPEDLPYPIQAPTAEPEL